MQRIYFILTILGLMLPYSQFLPWIAENGFNVPELLRQATASRIAAFAWADVLVSVLTIIAMILTGQRRDRVRLVWLPLPGCVTVSASLGLP